MGSFLRTLGRAARRAARPLIRRRAAEVEVAGRRLALDPRWPHEQEYLDYLTQGRVNGPIGMDAWVFGTFVPPGGRVVDAGANIGFTALLALRAGAAEIHCFEPDPRHQARLRRLEGGAIHVHDVALGARGGTMTLHLSSAHNQGSTLNDRMVAGWPKAYAGGGEVEVGVAALDDLFPEGRFDLLKLDIEGAELEALRGAAALLADATRRPSVVYVEAYEEFFAEVRALLAARCLHAGRVVCAGSGAGCLVGLDDDVEAMRSRGALVRPPSYLFSTAPLERWLGRWSMPGGTTVADPLGRS